MTKPLLWIEFLTLFAVMPGLYALGFMEVPKIPLLLAFFLGCLVYLVRQEHFGKRHFLSGLRATIDTTRPILLRSAGVFLLSACAVLAIDPGLLFAFPRTRPGLWLLVMLLYPLLSAYPQETIYRAFLFRRYKPIMPSTTFLTLASVTAFSFLHIIFDNWIAVILTLPAGYLFTRTYLATGSLMLASLEHALYGCAIFTTGLGRFFYNPMH